MRHVLVGLGMCGVALLACKQEESKGSAGKEPASAVPAVTTAAPAATAAAPAESSRVEETKPSTRKLSHDEIASLKKSMASGTKVIEEQSFAVEFDGIGECNFISAMAPNERELVFFVFHDGKVHQGLLTYEKLKNWVPGTVNAVTFTDVDGDGKKDIVVIGEYMPGIGQAGKQKTPAAIVYMRRGLNFKLDEARSEKASQAGNDVMRAARLAK